MFPFQSFLGQSFLDSSFSDSTSSDVPYSYIPGTPEPTLEDYASRPSLKSALCALWTSGRRSDARVLLRVVIRVAPKRHYCYGGVHAFRVLDDASFHGSDVVAGMFMAGPGFWALKAKGEGGVVGRAES
ncbi:hypothetical protein E4U25_002810 [Claviceps purpurea]|nr:hypothetical protein E4U25_002810 [Claviceps purpurea]